MYLGGFRKSLPEHPAKLNRRSITSTVNILRAMRKEKITGFKSSKFKKITKKKSIKIPLLSKGYINSEITTPKNRLSAGSNDLTNPDSQFERLQAPLKHKIKNLIQSGLKGYLLKRNNKGKRNR